MACVVLLLALSLDTAFTIRRVIVPGASALLHATSNSSQDDPKAISRKIATPMEIEESGRMEDREEFDHIHLPYYMQLFSPIFHGQDHRLPAEALSEEDVATAVSESYQADEEPDEPKSNPSVPIGQSLMQDEERMVQPMSPNEECVECQKFISEIIKGCCIKNECNIRICEQGTPLRKSIKYSDLTKLDDFKERSKFFSMSPNQEHFRRLYMDFTAIGSILHEARRKVSPRQLCYLYMTETYNCHGLDVVRDRIDARMPSSVIPIQKYRNEVCRGIEQGQAWGTKSMCSADSAGNNDVPTSMLQGIQPTNISQKIHAAAGKPLGGPGAEGLGFPEVPLVFNGDEWVVDDSDAHGFLHSNRRQTAKLYLVLGNKSQKHHKTSVVDMIATMPKPKHAAAYADDELTQVWEYWRKEVNVDIGLHGLKRMSRATAMMKWMSILLFDFKKKSFFIENIPNFVRKALKIAYKYVDSKLNLRARGLKALAPGLQKIAYNNIAGYENPAEKRRHIEEYIQDYIPDLRDAELIKRCKVEPPYYKPKWGKTFRGVEPRSPEHRRCIEEAVNNFDNYNAFFARRLKPERRDYLCYLDDAEKCKQQGEDLVKEGKRKNLTFNEQLPIIISPADSRIMLIQKLEESRFWIKGEQFKLESLVSLKKEHYRYYQGGRMLISRLSPQDYHRFHFPIDGRVTEFKHYPGAYYSVNPIAIGHEHTPVFHSNKRMHAMIRSKFFGCVLYVSVAATNVGSIGHTSYVGQEVIRGMEHGFMQFGGSTVLIIFPQNVAEFDTLIRDASSVPIETIVQVGAKLGEWTGTYPPGGSSPCDDEKSRAAANGREKIRNAMKKGYLKPKSV